MKLRNRFSLREQKDTALEDKIEINNFLRTSPPEHLRLLMGKSHEDLLELIETRRYVDGLEPGRDINEGLSNAEIARLKDGLSARPGYEESIKEQFNIQGRLEKERKERLKETGSPYLFNPYHLRGNIRLMEVGAGSKPWIEKINLV